MEGESERRSEGSRPVLLVMCSRLKRKGFAVEGVGDGAAAVGNDDEAMTGLEGRGRTFMQV